MLHHNAIRRYHYSHRSSRSPFPSYMGTLHAMELPFVFGMPAVEGGEPEFEPEEVEFSKDIMEYWTNFVKNGYIKGDTYVLFFKKVFYMYAKEPELSRTA